MIPYFCLCICFFHFSTFIISLWSCLFSFIKIMTWIFVSLCLWIYMIQILYLLLLTSMFFLIVSPFLFLSPFKHLYFHLFLSQFLSLSLCTSFFSTLSPIFLFVPMFVNFSQSLSISLCDFVCRKLFNFYSFYVSVCLIDSNWLYISISFCLYNLFVSILCS
jgi:hypothetical protein